MSQPPEFQEALFWSVLQLSFLLRKRLAELASAHGITASQALFLCLLRIDKPVSMSHVTRLFGCDASNVTGLTDRLAKAGHIERHECASDRRIKMLRLTETGEHLHRRLIAELSTMELPGAASMNQAEKATLKRLLHQSLLG